MKNSDAVLLSQIEKIQFKRKFQTAVKISYAVLISLLGLIIYLSFILPINNSFQTI